MSDDQQDITKGKGLVDTLFQAPMVNETHIAILSSYEYINQGLREYNLDNKMDRFYIAPAFMDKLVVHITKNFMNLPNIKSKVFAVAFAVLAPNAIILTLNILLGGYIFFQSLSLLGYCMFPLDVGALIGLLIDNDIVRLVMLAWSSWAAYPFMTVAVNLRRKALALYPVFLMYISVCFLIIAID